MLVKYTIAIVCLITYSFSIQAQQHHLIYIQSENKLPFYVVLNGVKQYNSTNTGYAVVPKLLGGEQHIEINYVQNHVVTRVNFICLIGQQDVGYSLNYVEGKGLSLKNLQTQQEIFPIKVGTTNNDPLSSTSTFESMLADAVDDRSLKNKNITPNNQPVNVKKIEEPVAKHVTFSYTDIQPNGKIDTIQLSIPIHKNIDSSLAKHTTNEIKNYDTTALIIKASKSNRLPTDENGITIDSTSFAKLPTSLTEKKDSTIINNDIIPNNPSCNSLIGNEEVVRLKRLLIQQPSEEEMIEVSKKYLQKKCFTTEHVKDLSRLFLKEATRFQFIKMAYASIYDLSQTYILPSLLYDSYYISLLQSFLKKENLVRKQPLKDKSN